jgi:hypothetical protein
VRAAAPRLPTTTVPPPAKPKYGLAVVSALIAIAALVVGSSKGVSVHSVHLHEELIAWICAGGFLVFGSIASRRFASQIGRVLHVGGGPTAGAAIRLILTIVGLIIVVIVTLGLAGVNVSHLLAAGAITGVVIGIAAQQSLGNVFAGIVLIVAQPFTVGERIRVRSGSFGGVFDGEVRSLGLTYVDILTDDGPLKVPNLGMLASAVGPAPVQTERPDPKALYVDHSVPKRPPRTGPPHPQRRPVRTGGTRLPREIIRRMREQRAATAGGTGSDEGGTLFAPGSLAGLFGANDPRAAPRADPSPTDGTTPSDGTNIGNGATPTKDATPGRGTAEGEGTTAPGGASSTPGDATSPLPDQAPRPPGTPRQAGSADPRARRLGPGRLDRPDDD